MPTAVSPACTVIEAGPATIRQLSCAEVAVADPESVMAALDGIDDPVTLLGGRPVAVDALWRTVLRSTGCRGGARLIVVHPSGWPATRVERVGTAARAVAGQVVLRPRSWLLARAAPPGSPQPVVIVELTERIVVITGTAVVAKPRRGDQRAVAEAVIQQIIALAPEPRTTVLIDAPVGVDGAGELADLIVEGLRTGGDRAVIIVDDARLRRLATANFSDGDVRAPSPADTGRRRHRALLVLPVLIGVAIGVYFFGRPGPPAADRIPTTVLVEGRVAVQVPAGWPTQRVVAGPGSARVQVTSPSDPQVALHVTQSPVVDQTLAGAAESLKDGIDAEPPGVFVDFNPSGSVAGRPAVTYRERRAGHDIRWAVVVDRAVRIAIGCQSRPGDDDAVRDTCEVAVRSARTVG